MKIEVTHADIADGKRGDCMHCPVANALHRTFGCHTDRIAVASCIAVETPEGRTNEVETPSDCLSFINDFDDELEVEPFTFELPDSDAAKIREWLA